MSSSVFSMVSTFLAFLVAHTTNAAPMKSTLKNFCDRTCVCTPQGPTSQTNAVVCNVTRDSWPGSYPDTDSLVIHGEGLHELDANVFRDFRTSQIYKGLANLRRLTLADCNIMSISRDTFQGFSNLEMLDLSNNVIAGLTEEHVKGINPTIKMNGNNYQECLTLRNNLRKRPSGKVVVTCGRHVPEVAPTSLSNTTPASGGTSAAPKMNRTLSLWTMVILWGLIYF